MRIRTRLRARVNAKPALPSLFNFPVGLSELVFKDGELVARNGKVVKETHGMTHAVRPEYDKSIERTLKRHFSEHQTVSFKNCSVER